MFDTKVKMDRDLLERAKQFAQAKGYASVEEFVAHAVEKAMARWVEDVEEDVKEKLQGLGYLA